MTDTEIYTAGWTAVDRALALPNASVLSQDAAFSGVLNNLRNHLQANMPARDRQAIADWTAVLNTYSLTASPTVVITPPVNTFPVFTVPQAGPVQEGAFLGGILEGEIFGISKTVLLIGGVALWFMMSDGKKR